MINLIPNIVEFLFCKHMLLELSIIKWKQKAKNTLPPNNEYLQFYFYKLVG